MTEAEKKLLRMAEQIALNCSVATDPAQVAERLADHLNRFWDPRMRSSLIKLVSQQQVSVSPALSKAVAHINPPAG